jgi:hypothetical protein
MQSNKVPFISSGAKRTASETAAGIASSKVTAGRLLTICNSGAAYNITRESNHITGSALL